MSEEPLVLKRVGQFIKLRAAIDDLKEQHKAALAPWEQAIAKVEADLDRLVREAGASSIRTKLGTVVLSTRYTATLQDPDAFMKFVVDNKAFDMIDRRANATAVRAYVEEHSALPPGCNLNALSSVSVRKPPKQKEN